MRQPGARPTASVGISASLARGRTRKSMRFNQFREFRGWRGTCTRKGTQPTFGGGIVQGVRTAVSR